MYIYIYIYCYGYNLPNPLTPLLGSAKTVEWPLTLNLLLLAICICCKHWATAVRGRHIYIYIL